MDRAGIEKRAKIAAAKAADGSLTYVQLQARFGAGPRVIADALKRPAGDWEALLGRVTSPVTREKWEYKVVKVSRKVHADSKVIEVKVKDEGDAEFGKTNVGSVQAVLDKRGAEGWELVSSMVTLQDEASGARVYELHFKRRAGKAC